ncbi:hypothetical protein JOB18_048935 [Solea senegalensis]|uniref:Ropporin-1-like protein n=1 Tax=Solea senegalensis TaxID=28829 RepID=A0AAV6TC43_SOLSE|nr:ropporin-1-like protein [Solea senegalensis]XP_043896978.1 ropporin-1-like protein [Solea senegalensis]XP_043897053.1 ropporin-1-like protein [Solea senegalensis]KAG7527092.1 ropporin-1 isoform X1 [Solea senegalensis]KAG7527093.1 hypothetical protein JOB18_048935 [Solea senegalensis]KAG7527094.1 hypothetical protein JOB18_048935 [Solea senegalensis]
MPLSDTMYCSEQIRIPPELPSILKNFTKAAIRTQPEDLLKWAVEYFTALSRGEALPVKDRLEINVASQKEAELTPGLLKTLHKQLSMRQTCSRDDLQNEWKDLCLPEDQLDILLSLGSFGSEIEWMEFFALGCSSLGGTLFGSLKFACEILTEDKEDGSDPRIPFDTFAQIYTYLAHLEGDMPQEEIDNFLGCLQKQTELQNGMIRPVDFILGEHTPLDSSSLTRDASRSE